MSKWTVLAALGEAAKGGGSYYGQVAAEKNRMARLAEARAYDEKIHARGREERQLDIEDERGYRRELTAEERAHQAEVKESDRTYQEDRYVIERGDRLEDAEINTRRQMMMQDEAAERRIAEQEDKDRDTWELKEFFDEEGNSVWLEENKRGERRAPEGDDLDGLSGKHPKSYEKSAGKTTEGQRRASTYLTRMAGASDDLIDMSQKLDVDEADLWNQVKLAQTSKTLNSIKDPALRQYATAMKDWVRAKLRYESGAVIGDNEALAEVETYFPTPFDDPDTIAYKNKLRERAEFALYRSVASSDSTITDYYKDYRGVSQSSPAPTSRVAPPPPKGRGGHMQQGNNIDDLLNRWGD